MTDPTRPPDPTRPGRWCPEHGKNECAKNRKGGGVCHGAAISGLDACRMHAGQRAEVARAKGEALSAWSALNSAQVVSATEAVLGMLQMSWARVHLYAGLLQRQLAAADPGAPGGVGAGEGLIGHTRSASPSVGVYETGEAVRGLAGLEAAERDRCVRFAKAAHDMGIAEQQVRIAEQQGVMLGEVIARSADALLAAVVGAVDEAAAEAVRRSWPGWVQVIVPREIAAVAGGER